MRKRRPLITALARHSASPAGGIRNASLRGEIY